MYHRSGRSDSLPPSRDVLATIASALLLLVIATVAPVEASADECASTRKCEKHGRCTSHDGECVAAFDSDCAGSEICRLGGRCTAEKGICVATTLEACHRAKRCADDGLCYLNRPEKICDDGNMNASQPVFIGAW